MEFEKYGDELDVDIVDDDIDDMGDEEDDEYDEYDEDEGIEEESEAEASEESKEESGTEEEGTDESADEGDAEKDFAHKLLNDMGYSGTYEEAKAAYEAERGNKGNPSPEAPPEGNPEGSSDGGNAAPDYDAMAKQMLDSINAEFGLELKSFAEIDDLSTFADLAVNSKVGAIKAFRATNHRLIEQAAKKSAITNLSKPTRNVQPLPKSNGGNATVKGETISKRELREYMDAFPELSRDEAIKLIRRVKKN